MLYIAVHVATPLLPETRNPITLTLTMCRRPRRDPEYEAYRSLERFPRWWTIYLCLE